MKKSIIVLAAALLSFGAAAQDSALTAAQGIAAAPAAKQKPSYSQYWTESLKTNITLGQTGLFNWAAGGDNTVSLAAYVDGNANYKKDAMFWNNRLQLDYGFLYASSKPIVQKATDRIYLESKWGYQIKDKLYFSANFDFKTQFAPGYKYNTPTQAIIDQVSGNPGANLNDLPSGQQATAWKDARSLVSNIFSPAYTNLALGIDWKPKPWFSASFAPLTGGFVIVAYNSDEGALRKSYKMPTKKDNDTEYAAARFEFGTQLKIDFKAQINNNFTYTTQLVLFEDYLKDHKAYPCPRINWDNRIDWKLAKYFALTVMTNLIYDDMVTIKSDRHPDGGPAVQFKECLSFGFTYTIASKK